MTEEEIEKWKPYIKRYPELTAVAYELYLRHKTKDAKPSTYFAFAAKLERRDEALYRKGMAKFCSVELAKMEYENGNETNKLFL
jgi:outer membrane protein assembly factor BamD (BamD/ComL family)